MTKLEVRSPIINASSKRLMFSAMKSYKASQEAKEQSVKFD